MPSKGTYAVYKELRPIKTSFGDNLVKAEKLGFKYREEARLKQKAIDDANEKFIDEVGTSMSGLTPFDTGNKNLNTIVALTLEKAKDKLSLAHRRLNNKNLSIEDRIQAKEDITAAEALPEKLKILVQNSAKWHIEQEKGIADGSLLETQDYKDAKDGIFSLDIKNGEGNEKGQSDILLDEDMNPFLAYTSKNGLYNKMGLRDFLDGKTLPKNQANFNMATAIKQQQLLIGTHKYDEVSGRTKRTIKEVNQESVESTKAAARSLFNIDDDGIVSDSAQAIMLQLGRNPNDTTEADIENMRSDFLTGVTAGEDTENTIKIDRTGLSTTPKKIDPNKPTTPIIAINTTDGTRVTRTLKDGNQGYVVVLKGGKSIAISDTQSVSNLVVTKDGEIYGDITTTEERPKTISEEGIVGKGTFTTTEEGAKLTPTQVGNIAANTTIVDENDNTFKDAKAFRDFLDRAANQYQKGGGSSKETKEERLKRMEDKIKEIKTN